MEPSAPSWRPRIKCHLCLPISHRLLRSPFLSLASQSHSKALCIPTSLQGPALSCVSAPGPFASVDIQAPFASLELRSASSPSGDSRIRRYRVWCVSCPLRMVLTQSLYLLNCFHDGMVEELRSPLMSRPSRLYRKRTNAIVHICTVDPWKAV